MKELFDNTELSGLKLKNRFVRSATWEELADERGHLTEKLFSLYEDLAKAGVGTIITGYAFITEDDQPAPGMMGIYDDSFIEEYKRLTEMVHSYDARIILQVVYGGSQKKFKIGDKITYGPSEVENITTKIKPKEMNKYDISEVITAFADAAERAQKAGFDGVQLHAAHGYLLNQFLSPYYNRRTDEYGGSVENRGRIIFEIFKVIRERLHNFPVFIKINCDDFIDGGLSFEDSLYICKRLSETGIDAIEVSGGSGSSRHNEGPIRVGVLAHKNEAYFREQASKIAEEINTPVILVGGLRSLEVIKEILDTTKIQYFALCRPLLCESDIIRRWEAGDMEKSRCISCNKCHTVVGKVCVFNRMS